MNTPKYARSSFGAQSKQQTNEKKRSNFWPSDGEHLMYQHGLHGTSMLYQPRL